MAGRLYNHTSSLRSDFQPFARPSKTLRSDLPGYPGGVPYLTDRYVNPPQRVNATPGDNTNGRVQATLLTRSRDQKQVNKYQFVWVDTLKEGKIHLLSLQQMNELLATDLTVQNLSLNKILDRFHLYGLVSNNDADMFDDVPTDRIARTMTLTVWGAGFVNDYRSSQERMLRPYDACYFLLKKIPIPHACNYQTAISVAIHGRGNPVQRDLVGKLVWQIVPHAASKEFPDVETYVTEDESTGEVYTGTYWSVGHAHEYAQISTKEKLSVRRTPLDVARDISTLHMNATVPIIQFYCKSYNQSCS